MQKRKLKLANIVGIVVFAFALVVNIQTTLNGKLTIFQSGIAQTGGTGSGSGGDGSGSCSPCPDDESNKTVTFTCVDGTQCEGVTCLEGTIDCSPRNCCRRDSTIAILMNMKNPIGYDHFDNEMKKSITLAN